MNPSVLPQGREKYQDRLRSLLLLRRPFYEKEKSEFKSDLLRFKNDLVSYSARAVWLGKYMHFPGM